jgi:hypothetical protein
MRNGHDRNGTDESKNETHVDFSVATVVELEN